MPFRGTLVGNGATNVISVRIRMTFHAVAARTADAARVPLLFHASDFLTLAVDACKLILVTARLIGITSRKLRSTGCKALENFRSVPVILLNATERLVAVLAAANKVALIVPFFDALRELPADLVTVRLLNTSETTAFTARGFRTVRVRRVVTFGKGAAAAVAIITGNTIQTVATLGAISTLTPFEHALRCFHFATHFSTNFNAQKITAAFSDLAFTALRVAGTSHGRTGSLG